MKLHPACFLIALTFLSACAAPTSAVPLTAPAVTEAPTTVPTAEEPKIGDQLKENGYS